MGSLEVLRQHYTAVRRIVSISDYGSLRTVEAERCASPAAASVACEGPV